MAVTINKTDGIVLTTIQDGAVDTSSTNLTLIGRLYRNYGELVNENFVKLLENFANSSSPTAPIVGQLWFNTSTGAMNVYRSTGFTGLANLTTSSAQPNLPKQGDLWFDTIDAQLKLYTGSSWLVVSPHYTSSQTKTGVFAETIRDVLNTNHVCLVHYQQNNIIAIQCRDPEWIPQAAISGFASVNPGFNLAAINSQQFTGNASNALSLGNIEASRYLRNDINGIIDGSLSLTSDGLKIGEFDDFQIYLDGVDAYVSKSEGNINIGIGLDTALKLTENRQALFADGDETMPSISFLEDDNTGIYRVAENIIGVTVAGTPVMEISPGGLFVIGNIQATNFSGTLNAGNILASSLSVSGTTTTGNLQVLNNTILGSSAGNSVQIRAGGISAPNGLVFSNNQITFNGPVTLNNTINSSDGTVNINSNLSVNGALNVDSSINVGGILIGDTSGRLRLNSTVATGFANVGDFSMGMQNGIRSYNSPKMWIAFNGTLAGLAIYDSFHIDFVTRTSTNNYTFTTEYPLSSGAMAVVGSNGANLTSIPSVGATSFSITTTSENARMGLVVLSQ
jgi:hypothetical protein